MVLGFVRNLPKGNSAGCSLFSNYIVGEQLTTDVEVKQVLVHDKDFSKVSVMSNE